MPDVFEHKKSNKPHHKTETAHHEKVSATDSVAHLKKQRISFLTSYAELPEGVQFENQEEEEVIKKIGHFAPCKPRIRPAAFIR